tara:strand:+ start:1235 stop:2158 length:924 start_codon:yes stop_codon:yes gene_type:complete
MINIQNLSKSYGQTKALNNLNFTINKGEIFGLLGPNGAGKSTTIKIVSGLVSNYDGTILIDGITLDKNSLECKKMIGVVPQEIALYEDFSAYENLLFWGRLNGVNEKGLKQKIDSLLDLIGLENRKNDLIKTYSGGMKRRINIAAALLHDPKILFMDEPTTGVDPQSRNQIFDIIETLNNNGMTIIYTTHYMEEVERLCKTIAIIDKGKIIVQGTKDELREICKLTEFVSLEIKPVSKEIINKLQQITGLKIAQKDATISFECNPVKDLERILKNCNLLEISIVNIDIKKSNLESIFLQFTGKKLRD